MTTFYIIRLRWNLNRVDNSRVWLWLASVRLARRIRDCLHARRPVSKAVCSWRPGRCQRWRVVGLLWHVCTRCQTRQTVTHHPLQRYSKPLVHVHRESVGRVIGGLCCTPPRTASWFGNMYSGVHGYKYFLVKCYTDWPGSSDDAFSWRRHSLLLCNIGLLHG